MAKAIKLSADLSLDLDLLLRTRLLIQGGSGSGKSWLLRRLAEQLFGQVPVIIIDPEGEFASLREKFGYVLVGPGGETPADVRSAALVAHKLLELRASAVCDIYEMPPAQRHDWVRRFLEAMIDAPKKLWHNYVIIVDEAHMFAPEKNAGESVASESIISMASRGRKRGYCLVAATQRLGKLRKDVAAELQNVMIGLTSIDIDRKRAVEAMGVTGAKEVAEFTHQLKTLKEGRFWAFGRALTTERQLIQILGVETSHPKAGSAKHAAEPPPAPEKVRALLPKLADLPQQAEQRAMTEADLRKQVSQLMAQLQEQRRALERAHMAIVPGKEVSVLTDADRAQMAKLGEVVSVAASLMSDGLVLAGQRFRSHLERAIDEHVNLISDVIAKAEKGIAGDLSKVRMVNLLDKLNRLAQADPKSEPVRQAARTTPPNREPGVRTGTSPTVQAVPARQPGRSGDGARPAGDVPPVQQRVLNSLAELEQLGSPQPDRALVALLAGYTNMTSKGLVNALGALRSAGMIDYPGVGTVALTSEGQAAAHYTDAPQTSADVQRRVCQLLGGASERILQPLIAAYPKALTREQVAAAAGYGNLTSKGFVNAIGRLRTLGFVDYPERGTVKAAPLLFLEGDERHYV